MTLPAHVSEWFTFLMENGVALTFFDPNESLANIKFHSSSLLCFSLHQWGCAEGVDQRLVGLIDITTEKGSVSFYWTCDDDDFWDGPANEWQARAKIETEKGSYTSLSEYFLSTATQTKRKKEEERLRVAERAALTQDNTCIVIKLWKKSEETG